MRQESSYSGKESQNRIRKGLTGFLLLKSYVFHRPRFLSNALKLRIEDKETIPLFGLGRLEMGEKLERKSRYYKKRSTIRARKAENR